MYKAREEGRNKVAYEWLLNDQTALVFTIHEENWLPI